MKPSRAVMLAAAIGLALELALLAAIVLVARVARLMGG